MLYSIYELHRSAAAPWRAMARISRASLRSSLNPLSHTEIGRTIAAAADLFERVTRNYGKPEWDISAARINGIDVKVTPSPVWTDTWCRLMHFRKDEAGLAKARSPGASPQPRLLIVAPLSGHFATLLSGTVQAYLTDFDVYITDWVDARDVPVIRGGFDLDDYIDYVRRMITHVGPGANVMGVCQPGPAVLAAVALMSEDNDPNVPATMIFKGSPIDARRSPTTPNLLAEERPFSWFRENMIYTVPFGNMGVMRRVYPGFVQLASFMNMNWQRHVDAHWGFFNHLVEGDGDSAQRHREFYDEYLSVLDLTEEFYLDTIKKVFQEHHLPRGILEHRGRRVDCSKITRTALMTVEGENDDISGIGQTQAAHDICTGLPEAMRSDYIQPSVGHYGVFNGRRFETEIVPRVRDFVFSFHDRKRESEIRTGRGKAAA
jgi:poly(3-hydroxybutyrate) depolymerase